MRLISFVSPSGGNEEFFSRAFLDQVTRHLAPAVAPFAVAFLLTVLLVPLAIVVAHRTGMMALPDGRRRIHLVPTPVLGGLALYGAFATAAVFFAAHDRQLVGLLVVSGLAAFAFVLDDRFALPAWLKLLLETAIAAVAIVGFGYLITFVAFAQPVVLHLGLFAFPLTLVWLLGMQNTVNLLDGVDGLAAGVVAIVACVLAIAAASKGQVEVVILSAALAGACVGFLLFNFHPAHIFMGDSGSHFLGVALALLSILGVAKVAVGFALAVPLVALAVPILDTGWAIVRRRRHGVSIAHPDTNHIHHQLLDFGLSQRQTCLFFYSATGILGSFGLMLFGHKRVLSVGIVLLFVMVSTLLGERLQTERWRLPASGLRQLLLGTSR